MTFFTRPLARSYWTVIILFTALVVAGFGINGATGGVIAALFVVWLIGWWRPRSLQKLMNRAQFLTRRFFLLARIYVSGMLYLFMAVAHACSAPRMTARESATGKWVSRESTQLEIVRLSSTRWHLGLTEVESRFPFGALVAIFMLLLRVFPSKGAGSGHIPVGNYTLQ